MKIKVNIFLITCIAIMQVILFTTNVQAQKVYGLVNDTNSDSDLNLYLFGFINNCIICEGAIDQINVALNEKYNLNSVFFVNSNINNFEYITPSTKWNIVFDPLGMYSQYYDIPRYPYYKLLDSKGNLILEGKAGGEYNADFIIDSTEKYFSKIKLGNPDKYLFSIADSSNISIFNISIKKNDDYIYITYPTKKALVKYDISGKFKESIEIPCEDLISVRNYFFDRSNIIFLLNTFETHFDFKALNYKNKNLTSSIKIKDIIKNVVDNNKYSFSDYFFLNKKDRYFIINESFQNTDYIEYKIKKFYYLQDSISEYYSYKIEIKDTNFVFSKNNNTQFLSDKIFIDFNLNTKEIYRLKNNEVKVTKQNEFWTDALNNDISDAPEDKIEDYFHNRIIDLIFFESKNKIYLYYEYYAKDSIDSYDFKRNFKIYEYSEKENLLKKVYQSGKNGFMLSFDGNKLIYGEFKGSKINFHERIIE